MLFKIYIYNKENKLDKGNIKVNLIYNLVMNLF